jgi:hypothetical protein
VSTPAYICGKDLEKLHELVGSLRTSIRRGRLSKAKVTVDAALEITTAAMEQADVQRERAA